MSQPNIDLIRDGMNAYIESGDTSRISEDFVWDMTNFENWPDKNVYTGLAEFNEFMAIWFDPFEEWRQDTERLEDLGGDRVLMIAHQHARLKGSTSEVDMRYGVIYDVAGDRATRAMVYQPAEGALEAAGLAEPAAGPG